MIGDLIIAFIDVICGPTAVEVGVSALENRGKKLKADLTTTSQISTNDGYLPVMVGSYQRDSQPNLFAISQLPAQKRSLERGGVALEARLYSGSSNFNLRGTQDDKTLQFELDTEIMPNVFRCESKDNSGVYEGVCSYKGTEETYPVKIQREI